MTGEHPETSLPHPVVRQLEHPERKLTLLFIASSGLFALIGTTLGVLMLAALSGVSVGFGLTLFSAHPFLQIYGFIAEFVAGVAYSLLPRFKVGRIPSLRLGYTTYLLLTSGNILFLLSAFISGYSTVLDYTAALLILAGSATFASQVISLALRPRGGFPESNLLIILSSVSLVLISLALVLEEFDLVTTDEFSAQMILLALLGFAGSMIYTVEIRSVSFRQCDYRKKLAKLTTIFQSLAIGITFLSIFPILSFFSIIGASLFLASAFSLTLTIKIFEFSRPLMYRPAMMKMHFSILRYNEVGILSGSIWLLFGVILGMVLIGTNSSLFFWRDSFIHSIAIGFIGSTIIVFAPMLLPGLLGNRAPVSGLSYGPIVLLNAGILIRVLGDSLILGSTSSGLPIWESFSGPMILAAMIWLLIVLHNVGKRHESLANKGKVPSAPSHSLALANVRDATISVIDEKTGKELNVSLWFVEHEGFIYLLPMRGIETRWYHHALASSRINLEIGKRQYSGNAGKVSERKEVERVIALFKDKYGERVFRNFYTNRIDRALKVRISESG
jgi:hypothetical protein